MRRLFRSILAALILSLAPLLLPIAAPASHLSFLAQPALADDPTCPTNSNGHVTIGISHWNTTEGTVFNYDLNHYLGTVFDNTDGDALSNYSVTVYWGDGTQNTSGDGTVSLMVPNGQSNPRILGSHTYAEEDFTANAPGGEHPQQYTITVVATESDNQETGCSTQNGFTVRDAPITITGAAQNAPATASEGENSTLQVATFTDADPAGKLSDYSASTVTIGRATCSASVGTDNSGNFTLSISTDPTGCFSSIFGEENGAGVSWQGTATVDDFGTQYQASAYIHVSDAPVDFTFGSPSFKEGTLGQSTTKIGTVADSDSTEVGSANPFNNFTAQIDWGDSTDPNNPDTETASIAADGSISKDHLYKDEGQYTMKVTVTDQGGATKTKTQDITVGQADLHATGVAVDTNPNQLFNGIVANFTEDNPDAAASDFGGTTIDWGDSSATTTGTIAADGSGGFNVTGSHTYTDSKQHTITITIKDDDGANTSIATTIANKDKAYALTPASAFTVNEAQPLTDQVLATVSDPDPQGTSADYSAIVDWGDGTPAGDATVKDVNGKIQVLGSHAYPEEGSFHAIVDVSDDDVPNNDLQTTVNVIVNEAPIAVTAGPPANTQEGKQFIGSLATVTSGAAKLPDNDLTAKIDWGDKKPIDNVASADLAAGMLNGKHTFDEEGTYTVKYTVSDAGTADVAGQTTMKVGDAPIKLTALQITPIEGASFSGAVAKLVDASPTATANDYFIVTVDWGDGSKGAAAGTPTVVPAGAPGVFAVMGTHTYKDEQAYPVTISVTDVGHSFDKTTQGLAIVSDALLVPGNVKPIAMKEGIAFSGTVGFFGDSNPAGSSKDFSSTIDWGDKSNLTSGTFKGKGLYSVIGKHTYARAGDYVITYGVVDKGNKTTGGTTLVHVADGAITAKGVAVKAQQGIPLTNGLLATLTDADPGAQPANYTVQIDWGDATASGAGTVVRNAQKKLEVYGSHTYASTGSFTIAITVTDFGGSQSKTTAKATVPDAPLAATAGAPGPAQEGLQFSGTLARLKQPENDLTAKIDWGDKKPVDTVASADLAGGSLNGKHTFDEEGSYTVKYMLSDVGTPSIPGKITIKVLDAPLSPVPIQPLTARKGVSLSQTVGGFSDANPKGTAKDFTATINWGDKTSATSGTVTGTGPYSVGGKHTYAKAGDYHITVGVVDKGGKTTSVMTSVHVANAALAVTRVAVNVGPGLRSSR